MAAGYPIQVFSQRSLPVALEGAASVTIKVAAGDTVYYSTLGEYVTSSTNQGSIANGSSQSFTEQIWLRSGGASSVTLDYGTAPSDVDGRVVTGIVPSGDTTGATDTPLIQAALNGGGVALLKAGTFYINAPLTLFTNSLLAGAGIYSTTIQLASGANCNLLQTQNFASLVGTDNATTPTNVGWRDLTLDGNASGQAALSSKTDGAITSGAAVLTSATGAFASGDVGKPIRVAGAGNSGAALVTTIKTFTSATQVTLARNAATTVSGATYVYGAGIGVALYACAAQARDFQVRNCSSWGMWSEWASTVGFVGGPDGTDSKLTEFMIHHCTEGGWRFGGPHDLKASQFHIVRNGPGSGKGTAQFHVQDSDNTSASGLVADMFHVWGSTVDYGIRLGSSACLLGPNMEVEDAALAQIAFEGSTHRVSGRLFSAGVNLATVVGFTFLGSGFPGSVTGDIRVEDCGGGIADFTNAGGNHDLRIRAYFANVAAPNPPFVNLGSPSNSKIDYKITGGGGNTGQDARYYQLTAPTYSASITPNVSKGRWQTITVTDTTAFTINAPSNGPTGTDELTIEVLNSAGGAMGAITWNAAFVFAGLTWANPASTKKRYARFEWNGAKWVCTALATADY